MDRPVVELNGADALLVIGASERNADLLWATGFRAPDVFTYLVTGREAYVVVKDLELDRARAQVRHARVLASSAYERRFGEGPPPSGGVTAEVLRDLGLRRLLVPSDFPVRSADELREAGFMVAVAPSPLFPQRAAKSPGEIDAITQAQAGAGAAMDAALELIRSAAIDGDRLLLGGQPLTSQAVRRRMHHVLLDRDCTAEHTIVAGGEQGIDPHQEGHGPLPAHRPILIDVFPRHAPTGFYGDLTRTVVRGRASHELVRIYAAVAAAQQVALDAVRPGVEGVEVHRAVVDHFAAAGYESGEHDGRMRGFFHGTGHGVGLEIHEAPSLSRHGGPLAVGHVVTVEPGLYYPGVGGVRLEDLVVIEAGGYRNLTTCPKVLTL